VHEIDRVPEFLSKHLETGLCGGEVDLFGFIDKGTDPVSSLAFGKRAPDRIFDVFKTRQQDGARVDWLAARRLFAQLRNVHVPKIGEDKRAWDRRRGEHQHVHRFAFLSECKPLMDAETMLLVYHREREIVEGNVFLEKGVRADEQVDVAKDKAVKNFLARRTTFAAGEDGNADTGGVGERGNSCEMLARKDFGRRHDRRLAAGFDHGRRSRERDNRFS